MGVEKFMNICDDVFKNFSKLELTASQIEQILINCLFGLYFNNGILPEKFKNDFFMLEYEEFYKKNIEHRLKTESEKNND